ncbi:hypothetical protein MP228_011740 [Amoeboaphelidium protococcarum]|nr:hypothetical protein MP228_011740 [Amoeboaphelidium protococcarum]
MFWRGSKDSVESGSSVEPQEPSVDGYKSVRLPVPINGVRKPKDQYQSKDLLTVLQPHQMNWTHHAGGAESQTFYCTIYSDEGSAKQVTGFVLLQIAYSSVVSSSVQVTFKYVDTKSGQKVFQSASFNGGQFQFTGSNNNCSFVLDEKIQVAQMVSNDGKFLGYNVVCKLQSTIFSIQASACPQLQGNCPPLVQIGDGKTYVGSNVFITHKWAPYMQFSGQMVQDSKSLSLSGVCAMVHQLQSSKPHLCAVRWDFASIQRPLDTADSDAALSTLFMRFVAPGSNGKSPVAVCQSLVTTQQGIYVSLASKYVEGGQCVEDDKSKYQLATECSASVPRSESSYQNIKFINNLNKALDKVDILAELPYLIRKLLQTLVAKPFCFMFFDQVEVSHVGGNGPPSQCFAYHETTIVKED